MRALGALLLSLMVVSQVSSPVAPLRASDRFALVLGNGSYPPNQNLDSPPGDARVIAEWLIENGYSADQVDLRIDASKLQMKEGLDWLVGRAETARPAQVFVYYSGHGATAKDDDGDEKADGSEDESDEVFLCVFGKESRVDDKPRDIDDIALRDDEFFGYVNRLRRCSGQVVILMDACFSGGLYRTIADPRGRQRDVYVKTKAVQESVLQKWLVDFETTASLSTRTKGADDPAKPPGEIDSDLPGGGLVLLTASSEGETAASGSVLSPFTEELLDLLDDDADLNLEQSQEKLASRLRGYRQTPYLMTIPKELSKTRWKDILQAPQHTHPAGARLGAIRCQIQVERTTGWTPADINGRFATGEAFRLHIESNPGMWIYVLNIDAQGQKTVLTPEWWEPDWRTASGYGLQLPPGNAVFRFSGRPGVERFRIIACSRRVERPRLEPIHPEQLLSIRGRPNQSCDSMERANSLADTLAAVSAAGGLRSLAEHKQLLVPASNHALDVVSVYRENDPMQAIILELRLAHGPP